MASSGIQLLDRTLFDELVERARRSPRLRTNHNFHNTMEENPHRFLNVMIRGTYITPHRHLDPPKCEAFLILAGEIAFFTFDDQGKVASTHVLGRHSSEELAHNGLAGSGQTHEVPLLSGAASGGLCALGIDIQPGTWHTLVVLTDHAVCYEVKPGPYLAANDKDFAIWAPREGQPGTTQYLASLLELLPS